MEQATVERVCLDGCVRVLPIFSVTTTTVSTEPEKAVLTQVVGSTGEGSETPVRSLVLGLVAIVFAADPTKM